MRSKAVLASTAALCILAGAAQAQTAGDLEEIVVTAQRREQNLQEVPISVTSLSAQSLAAKGIQSTQDLTLAVPGLNWGRSTNFSQPTIRGVGSRNPSAGDEPNVATHIDGVYQPDSIGTLYELANIERIEVLKGPQGTLFGRNATGGAVNIITAKPSFTLKGGIAGTYGRFDYRKVAGHVSGPILGDKVAAGLSAVAYADDGYVENLYLGLTQGKASGIAVRPKLLIQPTDNLSFQLNGLYAQSRNNVLLSVYALDGNSAARPAAARPALNPAGLPLDRVLADQPYTTAGGFVPAARVIQKMVDGHVDWDLGWASLSGVVAGGSTRAHNYSLTEASPLLLSQTQYFSKTHYRTTEWVLASPSEGNLTWLVGVQGFRSRSSFAPLVSRTRNTTTGALTTSVINYGQITTAAAGFAEATWEPVERLFLTGGLRYSWDRKEAFNQTNANPVVGDKKSFDNLSPRAVIRYEVSDSLNVYASYTRGYKSGVYNASSAAGAVQPVDPEKISAFEIGAKADVAGRLRVSAAAYHYDYKDLQVTAFTIVNGASISNLQNAGAVKINGLEANLTAFITPQLSLEASASIIDTKVRDFPNAVVQVPLGGATGNRTISADVDGNELIRTPDYTFSLGATYKRPLLDGDLTLNVTAFFSDEYFADLLNRVAQPRYEVVNASATWRSDKGYYVTVFGQNLTDQNYAVGHLVSTFIDGAQAAKPRWFGLTVGYDF